MVPPSVQRIDKFDVLRRIGRGGMGSVYLARDPDIDRLVAIKLLNEGFDEEDLRGRFTTEARSASALRHVNIVTIFHTGTFLDRPFIVMEYVEGETFADIIASDRSITIAEKLQLLDQLFAGLQYAHAKGIVHRDIKPSNVMVDADGIVRILDFGIARHGPGGLTRSGVVLGTLNYMSPEQLAGSGIDARADIFSAGLVAYELLTSRPAFPQAFPEILRQISFEDPPPVEQWCPGIEPALVRIVKRCYSKQRDDRYSDCAAVRRDLDGVRQSIGSSAADAAPNVSRPVSAPSSTPPAIADIGETVRIDSRRPPTGPGVNAESGAPDVPMTMVIPRTGATDKVKVPATVKPSVEASRKLPMIAVALVLVLLVAGGVWLATTGSDEPSTPVSGAVTTAAAPAPVPVPPPAPASAPAGAAPERVPPPVATNDRSSAADDLRLEVLVKTSRESAATARRRAIAANGRRTQAFAIGDVRVEDGDRFGKLGQRDEAVRAYVDALRRFGEAAATAPAPTAVRVGGTVKAPKLLKRVSPEYPAAALTARQQGVVILEATIGASGKVSDVKVLRSLPSLDAAAVDAVRQWEYEPTIIDEVTVPVITSVAVEFKLTAPAPVRVGGAIKAPVQTKRVNPPYPPDAQAAGVQGVVIMEAVVGIDGKVTDVRVLRSIPLLDQAAMAAVRQWEYAPTVVNGVAVPVVMTVTVNFTLTPAAAPAAPPPSK